MKRKIYLLVLIMVILIVIPPLLAPLIHKGASPNSAIRAELVKRGHPYQSFIAFIKKNGTDKEFGERFDVTWNDFNSETGMTPTIFYVKKDDDGYYVVSAGTGP
jgi:hypothetical protein